MSGGSSFRTFLSPGGTRILGIDPGAFQWFDIDRDASRPATPGLRLRRRGDAPRVPETAIELAPPP